MYECPEECGSTTFEQIITQAETVHVDEAGDPRDIRQHDWVDVERVICDDCGAEVHCEEQKVYAVVVHPPDTTSDVVNVYSDRETAENEAEEIRSEDQRIGVAVKQYEVSR